MGIVKAEIEIINSSDTALFEASVIKEDKIRRITILAIVDTGAAMMAISETIKNRLGLKVRGIRTSLLADGTPRDLEIVGPVEIRFKDRSSITNALVLPGDQEVLLGAIPMEEMDVLIHPNKEELIFNPAHPNGPQYSLK
jgi:clan AA aspartic protease